jgi:hypothetical protein
MENNQSHFCLFCKESCSKKKDEAISLGITLIFPWVAAIMVANKYFNSKN